MRDQFRSDQRIGAVRVLLLIMHGARDWVVPIALDERLFKFAHEPKHFVRFPDGGHDDLDLDGASAEVLRFIAEPSR